MTTGGQGRTTARTGLLAAACAVLMLGTSGATAQSRYACDGLETGTAPVVEGTDGMFYRLPSDLLTDTRIPAPVIEDIAHLSDALATRGTRLVVVPLPTKGLANADTMGQARHTYGFDASLARGLYRNTLDRLDAAGVASLDALAALDADMGEPSFFATDPRLTNTGLQRLATALTEIVPPAPGPARFAATETGRVAVPSLFHRRIQSRCRVTLPAPETVDFDTMSLASQGDTAPILLVGGGDMAGEGLIAPGLFSAATGRAVSHVSVEGDALGALGQALASDAFATTPPEVLVWVVPVREDLMRRGRQPLREAAGLARTDCRAPVPADLDGNVLRLDLTNLPDTADLGVMLNLDGQTASRVAFTFRGHDGQSRRRTILRTGDTGTGRFLIPIDGQWRDGVKAVEISMPERFEGVPSVAVCGV